MEEKGKKNPQNNEGIEGKGKKKESPHKSFFICFCSKIYCSFPALYLHSKNIHDFPLSYKNMRLRNAEWSGNTKNVYYEFQEGYQGGDDNQDNQSSIFQQEPQEKVVIQPQNIKRRQKKKNTTLMTTCEENVFQILQKYTSEVNPQSFQLCKRLIQRFITFINEHYIQVETQQKKKYENYCLENTCNNIPYFYNPFYLSVLNGENPLSRDQITQLGILGKWLFSNKYTQFYIMETSQYQIHFPYSL